MGSLPRPRSSSMISAAFMLTSPRAIVGQPTSWRVARGRTSLVPCAADDGLRRILRVALVFLRLLAQQEPRALAGNHLAHVTARLAQAGAHGVVDRRTTLLDRLQHLEDSLLVILVGGNDE